MRTDDCIGCHYWDYVDDTGPSDEKMCWLDLYCQKDIIGNIKMGNVPRCYSEKHIKDILKK